MKLVRQKTGEELSISQAIERECVYPAAEYRLVGRLVEMLNRTGNLGDLDVMELLGDQYRIVISERPSNGRCSCPSGVCMEDRHGKRAGIACQDKHGT